MSVMRRDFDHTGEPLPHTHTLSTHHEQGEARARPPSLVLVLVAPFVALMGWQTEVDGSAECRVASCVGTTNP